MTSSLSRILARSLPRSCLVGAVALAWTGPVLAQGAVLGLPGTLRDADLVGTGSGPAMDGPIATPRIDDGGGAEFDGTDAAPVSGMNTLGRSSLLDDRRSSSTSRVLR